MTPQGIRIATTILMIIFGIVGLFSLGRFFAQGISKTEIVLMVVSIIITAVSAGVVFG